MCSTLYLVHNIFSFVNDFSRKIWVYFLKHKSEAFEKFQEWKTLLEYQTGKKIKCLRIDNELEFCSNEFSNYCKQISTKRHRTCRDTSQQNGITKRINRTILEKVRCMLNESGLDKKLWAEAVAIAHYSINRSPSSFIQFLTP